MVFAGKCKVVRSHTGSDSSNPGTALAGPGRLRMSENAAAAFRCFACTEEGAWRQPGQKLGLRQGRASAG
jgi:hypothetical protein